MILLTDEEILKALNEVDSHFQDRVYHSDTRIAKAQLKKLWDWGNETCPHDLFGEGTQCFKHACDICWQSILEEVKK